MTILAYQTPTFQPAMRIISAITNANPAVITTTFDHNYNSLAIVRLNVPYAFGMYQADQLTGTITVLTPTTFSMDIDTTTFGIFAAPSQFPADEQYATVTPIGEENSTLINATMNVL